MNDNNSSRQKPGLILIIALIVYVGLYALLCEPAAPSSLKISTGGSYFGVTIMREPRYKFGGKVSGAVFWPVQKLDQTLFPRRWRFQVGGRVDPL